MPVEARSASAIGLTGRRADAKMARVAREIGIELGGHLSVPLTPALLTWADRVLVMELVHADTVRSTAAQAGLHDPWVELIGPYAGLQEVDDPHGSWTLGPYRRTRDHLSRAVAAHLEQIAADLGI
ncbi:MAG: protein-tyrosine-phosphatase [Myxococcota bacterium]|jgi:protein-tyrosine-phosphatase